MDHSHEKEVYFDENCKNCQYKDTKEEDDPCADCLENPMNIDSHKPVRFKERK
jgi:hypothetical protein